MSSPLRLRRCRWKAGPAHRSIRWRFSSDTSAAPPTSHACRSVGEMRHAVGRRCSRGRCRYARRRRACRSDHARTRGPHAGEARERVREIERRGSDKPGDDPVSQRGSFPEFRESCRGPADRTRGEAAKSRCSSRWSSASISVPWRREIRHRSYRRARQQGSNTMNERHLRSLIALVKAGKMSRRAFVGKMVGLGLTAPLASQMLAYAGVAAAQPRSQYKPTKRGGGGALKLLWWQAPTLLNPHFAVGTKDQEASRIFYESLAGWDADGNLVPALAAEIPDLENGGLARDGMSVTWKLKPDVRWHDGKPLTADDLVFTWEYAAD